MEACLEVILGAEVESVTAYLTSFLVPEDGWGRVSCHLTTEWHTPPHSHHFVTWGHDKRRLGCNITERGQLSAITLSYMDINRVLGSVEIYYYSWAVYLQLTVSLATASMYPTEFSARQMYVPSSLTFTLEILRLLSSSILELLKKQTTFRHKYKNKYRIASKHSPTLK